MKTIVIAGLIVLSTWGYSCGSAYSGPPPDFKVAFIGDQGLGANSVAVLKLIKSEGAQMVLHAGDFDYQDNPAAWNQQIDSVLGEKFPYFAAPGNHDTNRWSGTGGYQDLLVKRLAKVTGANCSGEYGVNSSCSYQGLFFVLSGVGTLGKGHADYLRTEMDKNNSLWRICVWHKNQNAMQVGGKSDEVGWEAYETCRQEGAIIATGHEHSYHRTKTLTDITNRIVDPRWKDRAHLRVAPGATFVVVSGIAGDSLRVQQRCLPAAYPYGCKGEWGKIYTTSSPTSEGGAATYGALFCTFNAGGRPDYAKCEFKNIAGKVVDRFDVVNGNSAAK